MAYRSRRPNDGRQEGVVKDGGNSRHTLVYKTQDEKVITPHTLQLHANANAWLVMQSYKISSSHSVHTCPEHDSLFPDPPQLYTKRLCSLLRMHVCLCQKHCIHRYFRTTAIST